MCRKGVVLGCSIMEISHFNLLIGVLFVLNVRRVA